MDASETKRRATYQDVLDAPENMIAEIVDGELQLSRRPNVVAAVISSLLGALRTNRPDWILLHRPELVMGGDILVPKLAGWRRERMPNVPDGQSFDCVPDWVCEVMSDETEKIDRIQKLRIYAMAGVRHAWLVHPWRRTLEAWRLHEGNWLMLAGLQDHDRGHVEPFETRELDLDELWHQLAPVVA